MTTRPPAVAGFFYPGTRDALLNQLAELVPDHTEKLKARAVVAPHAGYMYSGAVAGEVYASVELPDRFIILCPNHTGYGSDFDVSPEDEWITPLGSVRVDQELEEELLRRFRWAKKDGRAHAREHALEVQLPFLQYLKKEIRFLPVCIRQYRYEELEELGIAIAEIIQAAGTEILIIASSDMTHYESQASAGRKDRMAIEKMEALDPRGLYDTIHQFDISMCGYLPATAAMIAAKQLGATHGKLLKYATSGDVTRDFSEVVGYAGVAIL
ncbi:MAG TPA: AmmeMemoRadiSam system protein B [Acidobacteriota bacterium]|nr:AmmeMemoRadiSam system protein B [Acidobacteriota bacterium]